MKNKVAEIKHLKDGVDPGTIISHVPELLHRNGWTARDLIRGAGISPGSAYDWARPGFVPSRFDNFTVARLCYFFDLPIEDILEYVPPKQPS